MRRQIQQVILCRVLFQNLTRFWKISKCQNFNFKISKCELDNNSGLSCVYRVAQK